MTRIRVTAGLFFCVSLVSLISQVQTVAQTGSGSPVASPTSACADRTPVSASASPTPASNEGITRELAATVSAMITCWNARDWLGYSAFLTPDFIAATYGVNSRDVAASRLKALADRQLLGPIRIDAALYGRVVNDDAASIQVAWREGFARYHESWGFTRDNLGWTLSVVAPLEIIMDAPAVGLRIELTDEKVSSPLSAIAQTKLTVLQGVNDTGGPFVMTVFALAPHTDPAAVAAGTPAAIFAGSVPVESESSRELVLENLPTGDYIIAIGLEAAIVANNPALVRWIPLTVTASDAI